MSGQVGARVWPLSKRQDRWAAENLLLDKSQDTGDKSKKPKLPKRSSGIRECEDGCQTVGASQTW